MIILLLTASFPMLVLDARTVHTAQADGWKLDEPQRDRLTGNLLPKQCHQQRSGGACWCVDRKGVPVSEKYHGKRAKLFLNCPEGGKGPVRIEQYQKQIGQYGSQILAMQCNGITGSCWCVDEDGHALTGRIRGRRIERIDCEAKRRKNSLKKG